MENGCCRPNIRIFGNPVSLLSSRQPLKHPLGGFLLSLNLSYAGFDLVPTNVATEVFGVVVANHVISVVFSVKIICFFVD